MAEGITVDDRSGSQDLVHYLAAGGGVPCRLGRLEYGDLSFLGEGEGGEPVTIGVEVKSIGDVLKCICDGRFAGHQLPGLVASYQLPLLVVEGEYRRDRETGLLQLKGDKKGWWWDAAVGSRKFMWADLDKWLITQRIKGGIWVEKVRDRRELAQFIRDLYGWWTQPGPGGVRGWETHRSHLAANLAREGAGGWRSGLAGVDGLRDKALLTRPSLVRQIAAQLPGIGWEKSRAVEREFGSVAAMMAAEAKEWMKIEGIGKGIAARVVGAVRGEKA